MALTVTEGTQTNIYTVVNGGTEIGVVKLDRGAGTNIADWGGSVTVDNVNGGSILITSGTLGSIVSIAQIHNAGTVQAGTVQINPVPVPTTLTFGTLGTAGGSFFATVSAASGAGTKHYVTGVDIVMQSGTADVRVLAGSAIQGTGVLAGGQFPAGGGISNKFDPPFPTGTNSELIYHFVGAGTAFIRLSYWKGV